MKENAMAKSEDAVRAERPLLLQGPNVALTMMRKDDVGAVARWHQNLEFTAGMGVPGEVQTLEMRMEAYDRSTRIRSDAVEFGVVSLTGELVGFGGLFDIKSAFGTGSFFVGIAPAMWGRGFGTEATQLICEYGFVFRSLHNIRLQVNGYNTRAIRAYEKVGFKHVGRIRGAIVYDGTRYDEVMMDLVRDELPMKFATRFAPAASSSGR
jgi:RimJ/RimL family protein N-acetyltransferase